ncbi:hypothetical protein ACFX4S_23310 [Kosakonia sp. YIM B13605]|uniref:hypothetical protein n=1 Tax=Kosakonia TaxID=1330547 RepID=UPI0028B1EAD1|nr:hypothetical protein [Kosakonia sacchari]
MSRISVRGTYLNSLPLNAISAYSLPNLENDEQLAAELNVAGIKVLLADIVYDMSHDFKAYTFAATSGNQVRFVFDDVNTSNDAYKMHQYLKSQLGRTIRVYITW